VGPTDGVCQPLLLLLWDPDWGGAFWKTNGYAPYPIWIWLNGHTWAQRQCEKAGIGYRALDNGFASCTDPAALQRICDRLGPGAVKSFFWRWAAACRRRSPPPTCAPATSTSWRFASSRSPTPGLDRPPPAAHSSRGVIRDHLDIGRPSQVALTFDRRINSRTPEPSAPRSSPRAWTRSWSATTRPALEAVLKEGRALRTETVIGDTRDFGVGRRLNAANWKALKAVGSTANQRLCDAQAADAQPAPDVVTLNQVTRPSWTSDGQRTQRCASATPG